MDDARSRRRRRGVHVAFDVVIVRPPADRLDISLHRQRHVARRRRAVAINDPA
jgi:hypothetical protein